MTETKESIQVTIQQYSDKAIVVRGNTKPLKEKLKACKGKFNPKLKGGPGWIFSYRRLDEVRNTLKPYLNN